MCEGNGRTSVEIISSRTACMLLSYRRAPPLPPTLRSPSTLPLRSTWVAASAERESALASAAS
eukprot:2914842-Rhodomonas_salina.2